MSRAKVFGQPTEFSELQEIVSQLKEHKRKVQSMLLKREYQRTQAAQRKQMLAGMEDEQRGLTKVGDSRGVVGMSGID